MSGKTSHCLVYVTAGDAGEARSIGRAMVEARLAACANLFPAMIPIFRWEGEVREGSESVLILKTTENRAEELVAAVKEMHSYDCPCVVILPISGGYTAFLDWISNETDAVGTS